MGAFVGAAEGAGVGARGKDVGSGDGTSVTRRLMVFVYTSIDCQARAGGYWSCVGKIEAEDKRKPKS